MDKNILHKILQTAQIKKGEPILEIGAGIGTLTIPMAEEGGCIIALEKDKRLVEYLQKRTATYPHVRIIHGDFLKTDLADILSTAHRWKVISNPPYNITGPLLSKLVSFREKITFMVMMLQKEVADKLTARPGSKAYSLFSVKMQYSIRTEVIHRVSRNVFYPPPKVDSTLLRLTPLKKPPLLVKNEKLFFEISTAIFNSRRKTLKNSLKNLPLGEDFWEISPIAATRRGEALTLQELGALTDAIEKSKVDPHAQGRGTTNYPPQFCIRKTMRGG